MSILDLIKRITSNHESGRLEINAGATNGVSSGTRGTLLFHEGKLVDARLGSLSGFQAVNAAVALRDAEISFDHVEPASHVSTITPNERLVLSRFFGIEAAEMEEPKATPEPDWNPAPEPVVPLAEAGTIPFTFFSRPRIAVACLALLLGVAVGAVALRSKVKRLQQSAAVASAVESQPSSVSATQTNTVSGSQPQLKQVTLESAPVRLNPRKVSPVPSTSSSSSIAAAPAASGKRDANVQDLSGQWRVINTVENTAYRSFDNLEVGFRLTIDQNGKEFTAKGEKFSENGKPLPVARRTPIQLKGSIEGDKVVATFIEDGRMRRTNGRFVWKLQNGGDGLAGTFVSTAANSRGRSAVTKEQ